MRTKLIILVALSVAGQAYADMIPLAGFRSVSVSGNAGRDNPALYSEFQSLSGPGSFDASVGGSATSQDDLAEDNLAVELSGEIGFHREPGFYHAESQASQTTLISPDRVSLSAILTGYSLVSLPGPYGPADAFASATFELTFQVPEPIEYQLSASRSFIVVGSGLPGIDLSLVSNNHGTILNPPQLGGVPTYFSGILLPDIYTLRFNGNLHSVADPLGDSKENKYDMDFRVTSVPDAGSTGMLLGVAFVALIAVYRKMGLGNASSTHKSN